MSILTNFTNDVKTVAKYFSKNFKESISNLVVMHAVQEAKKKTGYKTIYPMSNLSFKDCFVKTNEGTIFYFDHDIDEEKSSDAILLDFLNLEIV